MLRLRLRLRLIQPGKPTPNGFIESINGRFHDECLNEHFSAISFRLGNSLNDIAPAEFIRGLRKTKIHYLALSRY